MLANTRDTCSALPVPAWAERSFVEEDGITHEVVICMPRMVRAGPAKRDGLADVELSLSVHDELERGRWARRAPTIQVEGGSYTLEGARRLRDEIDSFLDTASIR